MGFHQKMAVKGHTFKFVECGLVNNRYSRLTILGITVDRLIVSRVRAAGVNDVHKAHKDHQ